MDNNDCFEAEDYMKEGYRLTEEPRQPAAPFAEAAQLGALAEAQRSLRLAETELQTGQTQMLSLRGQLARERREHQEMVQQIAAAQEEAGVGYAATQLTGLAKQLDTASAQLKALARPSDGFQPVAKKQKMATGAKPSSISMPVPGVEDAAPRFWPAEFPPPIKLKDPNGKGLAFIAAQKVSALLVPSIF